ncbi:hypothetical protein D3C87_1082880 [compost metagenome]
MQVQMAAQRKLVAVARGTVVIVATVQIAAHFAGVIEVELVAFFRQFRTCAVPVTEHPRRIAIESRGSLGASGQAQCGAPAKEFQDFSAGDRDRDSAVLQQWEIRHRRKFLIFFCGMNVKADVKRVSKSVSARAGARIMFCYK